MRTNLYDRIEMMSLMLLIAVGVSKCGHQDRIIFIEFC
ncbi:hypothetical protein ES703_87419 [subsurface metagenome]